jgi:hypothetical protein
MLDRHQIIHYLIILLKVLNNLSIIYNFKRTIRFKRLKIFKMHNKKINK